MNHQRIYYALISLLLICLVGSIGATYEMSSLLTNQSKQLTSAQSQINSLNIKQLRLINAKSEIKKYSSLYTIAQSVVPQNKDQTQTIRQIVNIANANNIVLGSITFPTSNLGTTTGSSTQVTTPSIAATLPINNPNLSQLTQVPTIPGVYILPITITSSAQYGQLASFSQFINFLQGLENNRQTAQITSLLITPNSQNGNLVSFTISLNIYIKPGNKL